MTLKPQDIVVLLLVASLGDRDWTYAQLAESTGLSTSQVHRSLQRAAGADLFAAARRAVHKRNLLEFLSHGIRYAFPAVVGPRQRGVPTAHSAPPLSEQVAGLPVAVWPAAHGEATGDAVQPLHSAALTISMESPAVYDLLALVDAVRVGRARDRAIAIQLLAERLQ